jgi:Flp pilus assembly protein TadD
MSNAFSTSAKLFFSILAILVLILITYANTLFSPFNFDDQALLDDLGSGTYPIWPINYRHFIYYSFSLNKTFSGLNTFSYHLTNTLFHFLTSVTVLLIAYKTFNNKTDWKDNKALGLATTTAFLFAVNPLHTEALTYISGRPSSMGAFFYLLALLFFILGCERKKSPLTTILFYILSLVALSSALLSKATTLTFPVSVVLYSLCFIKKESWHPSKNRLLYIYLTSSVLVVVFSITTFMKHLEKELHIVQAEQRQVIVQDGIKNLSDHAEDQAGQRQVIVPDGIKNLSDHAEDQAGQRQVIVPDGIKNLSDHAEDQAGQRQVIVPDGIKNLSDHAEDQAGQRQVIVQDGIKNLSDHAEDQAGQRQVIVQDGIKNLSDHAEKRRLFETIIERDCIIEEQVDSQSPQTRQSQKDLDIIKPLPDKNIPITSTRLTAVEAWFAKLTNKYAIAQSRVLFHALKLSLFPINLTFDYDFPDNWMFQVFLNYIPVAIWIIVIFGVIINYRRISPMVTFALLWFLLTLSPTNSFLPRADLLSERNLYLSSFGFTFLIAYVFHRSFFLKPQISSSKKGLALLMTLFLIVASLLITRNSDYRSNIHLWEDTYKKSPTDLKVLHNLSHFYLEDKRYQEALVPLLRLSRSNASDFYRSFAHSNLGSIYTQNGNFGLAKKEFQKGIELEPALPLGYLNLGTYYASRGEFRQARAEFLRARERYILYKWGYPMPAELDLNLARVSFQLKCFSEAEKYTQLYVQRVPGSSEGLLLQGKIYQEKGKVKLAEETYRSIQGGGVISAKAYNNLGILYIKRTQYEKALDAFSSSIKVYPQIPDAHYNIGKLILDLKGDHTLARKHLEAALAYSQSPTLKQEINRLLEQTLSP